MTDAKWGAGSGTTKYGADDESDDDEILEESPCGRWLKRREQVDQRDVPGIDDAFLAMDTEEGVEVVWNEVQFSERKNYKAQEDKIHQVFDNLTRLQHPNIIKFHRYWTDTHNDRPRVIFITELMSCGSLKQFLIRTKHNVKKLPFQSWKKWCRQILSALSYLHSCCPPIVHGNLTCDTIFIQHNGLLKIGSGNVGPEIDIYAFGICALEMAALEIPGYEDNNNAVTEDDIIKTVKLLDNDLQEDFILKCLLSNPEERPTARELLLHPLLFEVHSLRLLVSHFIVQLTPDENVSEIISEALQKYTSSTIYAVINHPNSESEVITIADIHLSEKLEKFIEDVRNGVYPLTVYKQKAPPQPLIRPFSPELAESVKSATPEPLEVEGRHIVNMMCNIRPKNSNCELMMTILLRLEDKMNRQLTCSISKMDSSSSLSQELVYYGFINEEDREKVQLLIEQALRGGLLYNEIEDNSAEPMLAATVQQQNDSMIVTGC